MFSPLILSKTYDGLIFISESHASMLIPSGVPPKKQEQLLMIWTVVTAIATLISMVAYLVSVYYLRTELKGLEKDRYLSVTNELFALWQSQEFMQAQLWLMHSLKERTWQEFITAHRAGAGELAFHRVGSFYDRVGTLVRMGLIDEKEMLSTMGGYAIAVWLVIGPLVQEARTLEHSSLFDDFEALLPACYECYVPALGTGAKVTPFALHQAAATISVKETQKRLSQSDPPLLLDVRQAGHREAEPRHLPGAVSIAPDEIKSRFQELPKHREIIAYCT